MRYLCTAAKSFFSTFNCAALVPFLLLHLTHRIIKGRPRFLRSTELVGGFSYISGTTWGHLGLCHNFVGLVSQVKLVQIPTNGCDY